MLTQEELLSHEAWKTKPICEQKGVEEVLAFRDVAKAVYILTIVSLEGTEPMTAYCISDPTEEELNVAVAFDFKALHTFVAQPVAGEFEALVKPKIARTRESSRIAGFTIVAAVVDLCLKGAQNSWTSADAERIVRKLPASGLVADVARDFVQAGVWEGPGG